jgi:hypothetical protein
VTARAILPALPALLVFLAALPAPASPRLDALLARGGALTAKGSSLCAEPLESAAFAAESSDLDYARAVGALGLCREVQGRYGDAHRLVSRALEAAPAETTADGKKAPWPGLRVALRRLDDRVARVLVDFTGELFIDGRAVAAVSGAVLAVDPGRRLFEARAKGRTIAAREVEARAGDLPTVDLRSPAPRTEPVKQAVSVPLAPRSAPRLFPFAPALSPRGVSITIAYVGLGTAVVAGVVAGVLEAQRGSLASGLAPDACPRPDASPRCAELAQVYQQRTGARNAALVAGGVGIVAAGVAVGVYFGVEQKTPTSASLTVGGRF